MGFREMLTQTYGLADLGLAIESLREGSRVLGHARTECKPKTIVFLGLFQTQLQPRLTQEQRHYKTHVCTSLLVTVHASRRHPLHAPWPSEKHVHAPLAQEIMGTMIL